MKVWTWVAGGLTLAAVGAVAFFAAWSVLSNVALVDLYSALADELDAVATHVGATNALGVSMGAGAICHLVERVPDRFERVVLALPAVLDTPRTDSALERLLEMGRLAQEHDTDGVAELLLFDQPAEHRDELALGDLQVDPVEHRAVTENPCHAA